MKQKNFFSIFVGAMSYILFVGILFGKGLGFIHKILFLPFRLLPSGGSNFNFGSGGLFFHLISLLLAISLFPLSFWLVSKAFRIKVSFFGIIFGFLMTAVFFNILKILFGLF